MSRGGNPVPVRALVGKLKDGYGDGPVKRPEQPNDAGAIAAQRAADIAMRIEARIPEAYRWGTLEINGPLNMALAHHRPCPVRRALSWIGGHPMHFVEYENGGRHEESPMLLIQGETHSLKSTLAAACVRFETECNRDAYIVLAHELSPEMPAEVRNRALMHARDLTALVVINDIGKVLGGAATDSGVAAQRRHEMSWILHTRKESGARTIVTTTLTDRAVRGVPGILECFGEDILARLTDPRTSARITLKRAQ